MNDRALLELAAKAVGGEFSPGTTQKRTGESWDEWEWIGPMGIKLDGVVYYPLELNGDALWLAATLRLVIRPGKHKGDGCTVESQRDGVAGCTSFRDCPQEQMRYAIVFVAAEIGKGMK